MSVVLPLSRPRGGLKGNRGRAAARRLQRKVSSLGATSAVVVWVLWLLQSKYHLANFHPLSMLQHEVHLLQEEEREAQGDDEGHHHGSMHRRNEDARRPHVGNFRASMHRKRHGTIGLEEKVLDESDPTTDPVWQDILQARIHLVDLKFIPSEHEVGRLLHLNGVVNYDGVYGVFCKLDWNLHKKDPSSHPMFRDLVENSPECDETRVKVPFQLLIERIRSYDATAPSHVLKLGGVVFHESRCGSTLVANLLASMSESHRVYSESGPPVTAMMLSCEGDQMFNCDDRLAVPLLRDTMYIMQRSDNSMETHVFFKIQSAGTLHIDTFLEAFPETPWFFVYRSPVEVMVSHLQGSLGKTNIKNANCVRHQRMNPPSQVLDILERDLHTRNSLDVDPIDYCAAHLASITESALKGLHSSHTGRAVNYQHLPDALWDDLIPNHLHIPVSPAALSQMQVTSGQYSKGRDTQAKKGDFQGDSEHKEAIASSSLKRAAHQILESSFEELEQL